MGTLSNPFFGCERPRNNFVISVSPWRAAQTQFRNISPFSCELPRNNFVISVSPLLAVQKQFRNISSFSGELPRDNFGISVSPLRAAQRQFRLAPTAGTHSWHLQLAPPAGTYSWHLQLAPTAGCKLPHPGAADPSQLPQMVWWSCRTTRQPCLMDAFPR